MSNEDHVVKRQERIPLADDFQHSQHPSKIDAGHIQEPKVNPNDC